MTSVPCPTCGNPNPTDATICSKCDAPILSLASATDSPAAPSVTDAEPQAKTGKAMLLFAASGAVALLVILIYVFAIKTSPAKTEAIKAEIYYFNFRVIIVNGEPADLRNCMVAITSYDTYRFRGAEIPKGGSQTIDAVEFLNGQALRFNPKMQSPQHIDVSCDTANGKRIGSKDLSK